MFVKFNKKNCKHTSYKLEADFVADPIWCKDCGVNLDVEEFPLSEKLQEELMQWVSEYGEWIDDDTDSLKGKGLQLEGNHNERGLQLFQEVKKQLGEDYPIIFVPSKSGQLYSSLKNNN